MLEERNIIYFDPFYFKNGYPAKPKYFVVLKQIESKSILASLPTRKSTIPFASHQDMGCLDLPDINLTCFIFLQNIAITDCNKSFEFNTYLYGHQIDDFDVTWLQEIYPNRGSDYLIWGKLKFELFDDLINCFKNSKSVKRKYKKLL